MKKFISPGSLSIVNLSPEEAELLVKTFMKSHPALKTEYLNMILGDDEFLKFFDIFAGKTLKVPSREITKRNIQYVKIFSFCEKHNFSQDSYKIMAKTYNKRPYSIYRILVKINKTLGEPYGDIKSYQ